MRRTLTAASFAYHYAKWRAKKQDAKFWTLKVAGQGDQSMKFLPVHMPTLDLTSL